MKNVFFKLIIYAEKDISPILLYGFAVETQQDTYPWKEKNYFDESVGKKPKFIHIFVAVLSEKDAIEFEDSLSRSTAFSICVEKEKMQYSIQSLKERPIVLFHNDSNSAHGPVAQTQWVKEFWNVNKKETIEHLLASCNQSESKKYDMIQDMVQWIKYESGIDLIHEGYRLGNFEHFYPLKYENDFEVQLYQEPGLHAVKIIKKNVGKEAFLVHCNSESCGKTILDQTIFFPSGQSSLTFPAQEPMTDTFVQVWAKENGELVFEHHFVPLRRIKFQLDVLSYPRFIEDSWTCNLKKGAPQKGAIIKQQIEQTTKKYRANTSILQSKNENVIHTAHFEGNALWALCSDHTDKGSFFESSANKDGEIASFLKIRQYMESGNLAQIIIADPYFSAEAGIKLLTRIPRSDLEVMVISSLFDTNPDTEKREAVLEKYEAFYHGCSKLLHKNLIAINILRENSRVFHGRYILRVFKDGTVDGFMLSNSINSMGKSFPFVISPMDTSTCLKVYDHLMAMVNLEEQEKKNQKERITCKLLYDGRQRSCTEKKEQSVIPPELALLSKWINNNELIVPENELRAAVLAVKAHWQHDKQIACKAVCLLYGATYKTKQLEEFIQSEIGMDDYIAVFKQIADEEEKKHICNDPDSEEFLLYEILRCPDSLHLAAFEMRFQRSGHVFYQNASWLSYGYELLFDFNLDTYVRLLDSNKSPIMFDKLAKNLHYSEWDQQKFEHIASSDTTLCLLACVEWMIYLLNQEKIRNEHIFQAFSNVSLIKRAIGCSYFLSRIVFHLRTGHLDKDKQNKTEALKDWLVQQLSCVLQDCPYELGKKAVSYLFECHIVSYCELLICLEKRISAEKIKNELLDKAIDAAQNELFTIFQMQDMEKLIDHYIYCMDARYGKDSFHIMKKTILSWNTFEIACEPAFHNYQYHIWYEASKRSAIQLKLLQRYHVLHPENSVVKQWIDHWRKTLKKCKD